MKKKEKQAVDSGGNIGECATCQCLLSARQHNCGESLCRLTVGPDFVKCLGKGDQDAVLDNTHTMRICSIVEDTLVVSSVLCCTCRTLGQVMLCKMNTLIDYICGGAKEGDVGFGE